MARATVLVTQRPRRRARAETPAGSGRALQVALAALGVAILAWPMFVFEGSHPAYLLSMAGFVVAAALLGSVRHPALVWLVVFVVAVIGTEVNGALAAGEAPLGSLRLLDATLLAAAAGAGFALVRERGWSGLQTALPRRGAGTLIGLGIGVWLVAMWLASGAPGGVLLRTDVRLVLIGGLSWFGFSAVRRPLLVAEGVAVVGALAALKGIAIYLSGLWTIGTLDRLQSATVESDGVMRVILVGGDTLLVLAPAAAILAAFSRPARGRAFTLLGMLALGGLLVSATRTSLAIAVLLALATALLSSGRLPAVRARHLAAAAASLAVLAIAGTLTGSLGRFVAPQTEGSGLSFRQAETRAVFDLPTRDLLLGQGLAGSFAGVGSRGQALQAGWTHSFPTWILLKAGVIGLLGFAALCLLAWRRLRERLSSAQGLDRTDVVAGLVCVTGILAMSLTLGRVALPEGVVIGAAGLVAMLGTSRGEA